MKTLLRTSSAAILLAAQMLASSSQAFDAVQLHTIDSRTYHLTISGKVLPRTHAGAAEVRIQVSPAEGTTVEAAALPDANGNFSLKVSFEGYPNEQVDWKLTAQSGTYTLTTHEGRHILSDDTAITVKESIHLTDHALILALR
ncbi:MAG: hypothetical protein A2992_05345 [Elusimicrobia bacterium RIFCSPLOWO2_01_FULL_59_12]|nr:MAG: hypothetical protein A2992_05345 [Elusimicrobia bacterium RIFCSPLOWO2_01_FULL_59_12]